MAGYILRVDNASAGEVIQMLDAEEAREWRDEEGRHVVFTVTAESAQEAVALARAAGFDAKVDSG